MFPPESPFFLEQGFSDLSFWLVVASCVSHVPYRVGPDAFIRPQVGSQPTFRRPQLANSALKLSTIPRSIAFFRSFFLATPQKERFRERKKKRLGRQ